jgi:short-subunit dehydrogenase
MTGKAIIIGNSDGIGLALTRELLQREWKIFGISRSDSPAQDPLYTHTAADVQSKEYLDALTAALKECGPPDLCVYCAGIGEMLDLKNMDNEENVFHVNLLGMVRTASRMIPEMVKRGSGHFIGLSSVADVMISPEAPSYYASKAGFSNYLEGLALAAKPMGVHVSNVRLGFVDTKMAKGEKKPFMMSAERAVEYLLLCMEKKPIRYTVPRFLTPMAAFRGWILRLKV